MNLKEEQKFIFSMFYKLEAKVKGISKIGFF
jgi:hypothetical protein